MKKDIRQMSSQNTIDQKQKNYSKDLKLKAKTTCCKDI